MWRIKLTTLWIFTYLPIAGNFCKNVKRWWSDDCICDASCKLSVECQAFWRHKWKEVERVPDQQLGITLSFLRRHFLITHFVIRWHQYGDPREQNILMFHSVWTQLNSVLTLIMVCTIWLLRIISVLLVFSKKKKELIQLI